MAGGAATLSAGAFIDEPSGSELSGLQAGCIAADMGSAQPCAHCDAAALVTAAGAWEETAEPFEDAIVASVTWTPDRAASDEAGTRNPP